MQEVIMLPIRVNAIYEKIKAKGFNPLDFSFIAFDNNNFEIVYKPNAFFFYRSKDHNLYCRPSSNGKMDFKADAIREWDKKLTHVDFWIDCLKQNIEIKNPWLGNMFFDGLNDSLFNADSPFDQEKRNLVDEKLDLILEALKEMHIDIEELRDDFEYFKKATDRVSQKDWKMMFMGGIFGWVIDKIIPADKLQDVLNTINKSFSESSNLLNG